MIVESPLILLESVYTSISNQRHFFKGKISFFMNVLVITFSICFGISALGLFYHSNLLECCLSVLAESEGVESFFCFYISFLFQKIQKYLLIIMHCIFHFT